MRVFMSLLTSGPDIDPDVEHAVAEVGRALLEARRRRGLSQRRLAEMTGVDQASISRIERGLCPYSRLAVVARLLVTLDLCRVDTRPPPGVSSYGAGDPLAAQV